MHIILVSPFGMMMPGRSYTSSSSYCYGFNGKENDNEVKGEGNQQDYGMRIYDPRLVRFLSVDPISKNYPQLTPYQFAGNIPIRFIDLDGLEPADYKKDAKHLVIVNLGYAKWGPEKGKTQAKNGSGDERDGLSSYFIELAKNPEVQVVVFSSSLGDVTEDDIVQTVKNFNKGTASLKGNKTVSFVGHSLGADQLMETLEENNVAADMLIALDLSAGPLNDNETVEKKSNVKLVIGFYQTNDVPGGNILDSNNPKTTVANYEVSATHTTIDNKLGAAAAELVRQKTLGTPDETIVREAEGLARTFNTLGKVGAPKGTMPRKP